HVRIGLGGNDVKVAVPAEPIGAEIDHDGILLAGRELVQFLLQAARSFLAFERLSSGTEMLQQRFAVLLGEGKGRAVRSIFCARDEREKARREGTDQRR